MWHGSTWASGKAPNRGDSGTAEQDYQFSFPGRTIKSIEVSLYKHDAQNAIYFESSRTERPEDGKTIWQKYVAAISIGTEDSALTYNKSGIGTDTATIPTAIVIKLNADSPEDITNSCTTQCSPNTTGYRIYTPVLFQIELTADLSVHYKTIDGKSLNDIFPPRIEHMKPGTTYEFQPPTHEGYTYAGYKKTTDGSDPSTAQAITKGHPPALQPYTGSFEQYRIYQYYEVGQPCQPGQTSADNEQCEDEAPASDGKGGCAYTILPPISAQTMSNQQLNPEAAAHILSDDRANGRHFDATQGIPTSEYVYANAWGYAYLFQHTFAERKGTIRYDCEVRVRYSLKWQEKNSRKTWSTRTASETKTYTFSFTRPYAYWQIQQLQVLGIAQAKVTNHALPGGTVTLPAAHYMPPTLTKEASTEVKDHVRPANSGSMTYSPSTLDGGKSGRPSLPNDQSKLQHQVDSQTD
ncbi:DUF5704 domain-containing protein, partial [Paenibacillus sp. SGZ-1009]|uniref:DUF5704 domain-containing protein n=1 Tax=Paenibacillus campi TaxID=3106031 RepID=UPI002AFEC791